jgi:hypothetical protein
MIFVYGFDGGQLIAQNVYTVIFHCDFQDLVNEVGISSQLVQRLLEEVDLHLQIHTRRPVETHKSGVKGDIRISTSRAGMFRWAAEVHGVLGNESPIPVKNDRLKFLIP